MKSSNREVVETVSWRSAISRPSLSAAAEIFCQVCVRIGQSLVLANETAQLFGKRFHALLDLRIFGRLRFFGDCPRDKAQIQQNEKQ